MDSFLFFNHSQVQSRIYAYAKSNARKYFYIIYLFLYILLNLYFIETNAKSDYFIFYIHFFLIFSSICKISQIFISIIKENRPCFIIDILMYPITELFALSNPIVIILIFDFFILYFSLIIREANVPIYFNQQPFSLAILNVKFRLITIFGTFPSTCEAAVIFLIHTIVNVVKHKYIIIDYKIYRKQAGNSYITECSICKDSFTEEIQIKMLNCKHVFHEECIDQWFEIKNICPLCKSHPYQAGSLKELLQTSKPIMP